MQTRLHVVIRFQAGWSLSNRLIASDVANHDNEQLVVHAALSAWHVTAHTSEALLSLASCCLRENADQTNLHAEC